MLRRTRATAGLLVPALAAVAVVLAVAGGGGSSHRPAADPFAWLHPV